VSHHLRLLRAARLLKAGRRGKQVFYSIADSHVREMLTSMIEHLIEPHEEDDDVNAETGVMS
jgi:ArsR family transcriptional regulator, lead/cadmium/zinc/bismuth-responsive transcriptional repressor